MVGALLWGCNGSDIDDPTKSDSLLVVQSVTPASIQADVSPTTVLLDPNTSLTTTQPPKDDVVSVKVSNIFRGGEGTSGAFTDIFVSSMDITCANGSLQLAGSTAGIPTSLSIPGGTTGDIVVVVAPGPYKEANMGALLAIGVDTCRINFNGHDLGGEPVQSTDAVVRLSYVNTP
jgi:hypothetical protein